ncbi:MAG: hypothetical protein QM775_23365 [Pirellulales bacterium]
MAPLSLQQIALLDRLLASGTALPLAMPQAIGESSVFDGVWRFFSNSWPEGGVTGWNSGTWNTHWQSFLPAGFFCFGEDVFGNQLVVANGSDNALIWNHENGECNDLLVGPCELLRTALESGIDWIDFYSDGSLAVAKQYGAVPFDMHLHWTTPLILGGQVDRGNLSLVQREAHLVGHAKLCSQVSGLPLGTTVISPE